MSKKSKPAAAPMSVRRSLALSFARKYTNIALTVPAVMIVSRLLTPAQIGVYSVGMAFVAIAHTLKDFGVGDYLIQAHKIDARVARSAFTINLLIASTLGALLFAASWSLAAFYHEPGIRLVIQVLSINFFLLPFGSTIHSLLRRSMQFGIIYKVNLLRQMTQSGLSVLLAYLGLGYMSMAWSSVAATVIMIFALATLGRAYRIRGLSLYHWRDIASFGVQKTGGSIVSGISNKTSDFVIGRVIDFAAVGLYSRGKSLIRLFMSNVLGAISPVTYPTYARMFRNKGNPHVLFLKALVFMTGIAWPFLGFAALLGFPIIRIMFGTQWDSVVPILQIVAIGAVFNVTTQECSKLFTAMGRIWLVTRIVVSLQFVRIPLLILAAFHGLLAVATVSIVSSLLSIAIYYPLLFKYTDLAVRDVLHALYQSFMVALSALLLPVVVVFYLLPPAADNLWPPLLLSAAGSGLGWLAGLCVIGHPLWPEMQSWLVMFFTQAKKRIKWVS